MKIVRCRPSSRSIAAARRARRSRASSRASGSSAAVPPKAGRASSTRCATVSRDEPAGATQPGFPPIEAAVDENAGEPDLEGPRLAIRLDVAEDLDERVLHRFVGFGGIVQILIRDPHRPALMNGHELGEALARPVEVAVDDEVANLDGNPRVVGQRRRDGPAIPGRGGRASPPVRNLCRRRKRFDVHYSYDSLRYGWATVYSLLQKRGRLD